VSARLPDTVRAELAREIGAAGGREVSFVGTLDSDGRVAAVRVAARGTIDAVLALPGVARRGEMLLHNHPSGVLEPSAADLHVAAQLHDGGVGFGILDNEATALYVVVEAPQAPTIERLDPPALAAYFGAGGLVARALGAWEDRPSQRDMVAYVADMYNDGGVALVEAGTGVGKSFAYLAPALEWARANDERTVVSTNTINLQEQLVGRDLPTLQGALARDDHTPTFALLKGWRNFVCLLRLQHASAQQDSLFEPPRVAELDALVGWAEHTSDGSLNDLPDRPSNEVWDEVVAEPDLCHRLRCPHFERCFVFAARRRAAQADVVVVNHHLLASDLAVRIASDNWQEAAVLPPYRRLVIDEAHHLEDTAAQHLGVHVSSAGVNRLLSRLERNGRGLFPTLVAHLVNNDEPLGKASLDLVVQRLLPGLRDARTYSDQVFGHLTRMLVDTTEPVLRLTDRFRSAPVWGEGLELALENLVTTLATLRDGVETVAERLALDEPTEARAQLVGELRGALRRLQAAQDGLIATLKPGDPAEPTVRWLERRGERGKTLALAAVPLDLAPLLKDALFDRVETAVLTSATLAVGGDFGFLEDRLGLDLEPSRVTVREVLPSPFDFGAQCLFAVPTDLPDPTSADSLHDEAVGQVLIEVTRAADGGVFALFTSHRQLRRVAELTRGVLGGGWPMLVQGDAPRDRLLQRFRELGNAVLLGTDSFWEGVDVPGRALRALVLAKLPFKVPTEPLTQARLERLASRGMDGFTSYLLPHAALKLKQGFGRLVRSRADVGVVALLDRRVVTKRYGSAVIESLPPAARAIGPWNQVLAECEEFFAGHGIGAMPGAAERTE
jgi:ATP-dependent DNA helicase DinG